MGVAVSISEGVAMCQVRTQNCRDKRPRILVQADNHVIIETQLILSGE